MEADKDEALKQWREKRRARQRERTEPTGEEESLVMPPAEKKEVAVDDDNDEEIITPAQKRRMEQEEIERLRGKWQRGGVEVIEEQATKDSNENKDANSTSSTTEKATTTTGDAVPATAADSSEKAQAAAEEEEAKKPDEGRVQSLLEQAAALNKSQNLTAEDRAARQRQHEEELLLRHAQQVGGKALKNAKQAAQGIQYTQPMPSTWRVPRYVLDQGEASWQKIRKEWHIDVEGSNIPPPLPRFLDMKFPKPVIDCLQQKGITRPTPIQMQGIPIALAGRDVSS